MNNIYLFDWGDTLMIDFPGIPGKMCDWKIVEALPGAKEALSFLSKQSRLYIATDAAESDEIDIQKAFQRVELDHYLSGYFCKANMKIEKGSRRFLLKILKYLNVEPRGVTMVGDNFEKDILPAVETGMNTIWLSQEKKVDIPQQVRIIHSLLELCKG